ncbi:hypothetical protein D3C77_519340 [compost metagenome]
MIRRCGNGVTESAAGVASGEKLAVDTTLASDGLSLPATLLIASPALADCSLSVPMRAWIWDIPEVAWPYMAATSPTLDWARLMPRMVRCSLAPTSGPTNGILSSSDAAPVMSPIAPFMGPSMPSSPCRPASPACTRDFKPDSICSM